jgi:threonine dehydrogenase-like Zn-dependent dehydrogenase
MKKNYANKMQTCRDSHDPASWKVRTRVEYYGADIEDYRAKYGKKRGEQRFFLENKPEEVHESEGNLLMYGGASCLWQCLIGNGTGTSAQTLTYFNNGNAAIGVGDSTTAEAATQTDLQASSNKARVAMDATYPQHTDATTSGAATITFKSTFNGSTANFAWAEWGVFNATSGGRMLNRKVQANGTKSSGTSAAFTVTITLS